MKPPFPAYFFDASGNPFDSVRCRPCTVLTVNEQSNAALIAVGSLAQPGRVEKYVTLHALASTREKAAAKFLDLLVPLSPAPAEKSAVPEMAGADAGTLSP